MKLQRCKSNLNVVDLELKKNKDILSHVAKVYKSSYVVGFAAETKNVKENARTGLPFLTKKQSSKYCCIKKP